MKWGNSLRPVLFLVGAFFTWPTAVCAEPASEHQQAFLTTDTEHKAHEHGGGEGWEGSAEGIAYSEFNHHFTGLSDLLLGLTELANALQYPQLGWARFVLPGALGITGVYLFVWSDHDAWPIGSLSFAETFGGHDPEIIEHKFYSLLALAIAVCETPRRISRVRHPVWAAPLVFLVLIEGLLLFVHSHGNAPPLISQTPP